MKNNYILWTVIAVLAGALVFTYFRHTPATTTTVNAPNQAVDSTVTLAQKENCSAQEPAFEKRVQTQTAGIAITPNDRAYDFFIAYSPSMNTCIGGYTWTSPREGGGYYYTYSIVDALTGKNIQNYQDTDYLIRHPEISANIKNHNTALDSAAQMAWDDYKKSLSDLSAGQL
jgi:hypothetical protein